MKPRDIFNSAPLAMTAVFAALTVIVMLIVFSKHQDEGRASQDITIITVTNVESVFIRHITQLP